MKSHFLIAAPSSGSGKTTVTLGVLRALQRLGYSVQPFKCGPDYIDSMHSSLAAKSDCINLDRFMMSDEHIKSLYYGYGSSKDIGVTEGVMGLFDGTRKMEGSSADIAMLLDIPVIIILNAESMAYSAAAILYGLKNFCPQINIGGVIFNFVEHELHYQFLREACQNIGIYFKII
ncbi:MAG: AAA family ATPase [Bacteroidetes bacterium]|nr:AAA family ATPase [Bacteroidota bacterium]